MFKVCRKSEYALLSVQVMALRTGDSLVSVAELAASEGIPPDILAKVLQTLKRTGILLASKGAGGGYRLAHPLSEIRFLDVVRPFEEHMAVATCQNRTALPCERMDFCRLRDPMSVLNSFVMRQVDTLTMAQFLAPVLAAHGKAIGSPPIEASIGANPAERRSVDSTGVGRSERSA